MGQAQTQVMAGDTQKKRPLATRAFPGHACWILEPCTAKTTGRPVRRKPNAPYYGSESGSAPKLGSSTRGSFIGLMCFATV
jgi:hypothetical protein